MMDASPQIKETHMSFSLLKGWGEQAPIGEFGFIDGLNCRREILQLMDGSSIVSNDDTSSLVCIYYSQARIIIVLGCG